MNYIILLPLVVSLVLGLTIGKKKFSSDTAIANFAIFSSLVISVCAILSYIFAYGQRILVLPTGYNLTIQFHIDGLTVAFGTLVSVLWPVATYYAKTYMTHEGEFQRFFTFYILTFGVVLGLASSENMFTLYLFYELLTFITLPLVAHSQDARAMYAGKVYVAFMIFGASLSFAGMMIFLSNEGSFDFMYGGITSGVLDYDMLIAYVLMFVGFGIKAGLFPFYKWLLVAGVAPTTVTALLHAVAVVKSGAFATMRLTYYLYNPDTIRGTLAQIIVLIMVIISVLYGSYMAVKAQHLKRRLAYSTVSQLSYILLGVAVMSDLGLKAALLHMLYHALCKIVLFYSAGNLLFSNHKEYLQDIKGYGRSLGGTFLPMTICGFGLIGVPPFGGFFSKYGLAQALFEVPYWGVLGIFALVFSAFYTTIYIFQIIQVAYLPEKGTPPPEGLHEVPKQMESVLMVLTVAMVVLSFAGGYVLDILDILIKVGG